ncbi:hypothetical protein C3A60_01175 [Salmonella enterica subsp. enterica serovar Enteritidis]|nr:hypothetical protein [Salmonella enterica subsp. enterica serovar Enteritidis]
MIASLDELYHSELFFLPVMDENARLVGLEIIATFAAEDGAVRLLHLMSFTIPNSFSFPSWMKMLGLLV